MKNFRLLILKGVQKKTTIALLSAGALLCPGCNPGQKDAAIKANIAAVAKDNVDFAAVNYMVKNGIVTLTGTCSSEKAQANVIKITKNINVVEGIDNRTSIGTVLLNSSFQVKQTVDSVLALYPQVVAEVTPVLVVVKGNVPQADARKLLTAIHELPGLERLQKPTTWGQ